jgi:hypothetical protein
MPNLSFTAGTKLAEFVTSSNDFDVIEGPLGSGKTVALCLRVMRHAQEQVKSPIDGLRNTRFALVRNTYPDLKRTTIRTWLDCVSRDAAWPVQLGAAAVPQDFAFGDVRSRDRLSGAGQAGGRASKLRSAEYTGIYFNELPYIDQGAVRRGHVAAALSEAGARRADGGGRARGRTRRTRITGWR